MDQRTGTFLVTHADDGSAVLKDPESGQVHALEENPGLAAGDVVEGTVEPVPPVGAAWRAVDLDRVRSVAVERSEERPTRHAREAAADQPAGELTRIERAGTGELHVLTVPAADTEEAAADVLDDEEGLLLRAVRLGVGRVEVRAADGVVSVRYLP